jgi:hypothetical protein
MPVPTVALALPVVLVTVCPTVMEPLLLIVLDEFPDVAMPPVLEVIEPLLVMVTGFGPPAVTAVLDPPLIVPLLTSDPPFGRFCGPTVAPRGIVTALTPAGYAKPPGLWA